MTALVNPHGGGPLKPLLLEGDALAAEHQRAQNLPRLIVSSREAGDLIMLGIGGFTPLDGFMSSTDWRGVCDTMHTADGLFWPIPITLSTDSTNANAIAEGDEVALHDNSSGALIATLRVDENTVLTSCMNATQSTKLPILNTLAWRW